MKSDQTLRMDLAARLKDLEHFTGPRRRPEPVPADGPVDSPVEGPVGGASATRVPVPRRSRVFLRHGEGHGVFAELTLTAPRTRAAHD